MAVVKADKPSKDKKKNRISNSIQVNKTAQTIRKYQGEKRPDQRQRIVFHQTPVNA
jgi:hypothetical protein